MNYDEAKLLLQCESHFLNPDAVQAEQYRDRIEDQERRADRDDHANEVVNCRLWSAAAMGIDRMISAWMDRFGSIDAKGPPPRRQQAEAQ